DVVGRNRKLDESCSSNPRSEIAKWTVQSEISAFGSEMQDSSDFQSSARNPESGPGTSRNEPPCTAPSPWHLCLSQSVTQTATCSLGPQPCGADPSSAR